MGAAVPRPAPDAAPWARYTPLGAISLLYIVIGYPNLHGGRLGVFFGPGALGTLVFLLLAATRQPGCSIGGRWGRAFPLTFLQLLMIAWGAGDSTARAAAALYAAHGMTGLITGVAVDELRRHGWHPRPSWTAIGVAWLQSSLYVIVSHVADAAEHRSSLAMGGAIGALCAVLACRTNRRLGDHAQHPGRTR